VVRRIPIRAKVAGAVAVPLVGLVAAAGIGVAVNTSQARSVARQADLATASIGHAGLIGALQNERNLAVIEMYGLGGALDLEASDTDEARRITDEAGTALQFSIAGQDEARRADYDEAVASLADLESLRQRVDEALAEPAGPAGREAAHDVFASYSVMVSRLFTSHDRFTAGIDDPVLRQGDDLVHDAAQATDAAAQLVERLLFLGSGPGGIDDPVEVTQIAELRRDVDTLTASVEADATGPYAGAVVDLVADQRVAGLPVFAGEAIATGGSVSTDALMAVTPLGPADGYLAFRDQVVDVLDAEASHLVDQAEARRRLVVIAATVLVAAAVAVAWAISRSITRPLRELRVKARSMAAYRLPAAVQAIFDAPPGEDLIIPEAEPISVRARDEVADVVQALNGVHESALILAVEQAALRRNVAESYVNLGRRNQNLLSRLLDEVGELERDESDPAQLRKLYRLDHLATRIRRNAESLLVLSQTDAPAGWQPPVAIEDVVRAALGEVEHYERVLVRTLDPVMVMGGSSADLAHLLAELIENGLRHSPPRELVEISGRTTGDGYLLNIVDHGLGMTPDDIERANARLAGAESFTVTPAKYLGHYVTAVLATRHGIKVRLQGSVVVGIAALVELPAALLAGEAPAPAARPAPPPPGPEARRPAPVPALAAGPPVPARVTPDQVVLAGGVSAAERVPERTASGLVRRVRGAHVPAGVTGADRDAPYNPPARDVPDARAVPDAASSSPVDGAEMQRFLTSLVGGVQRSLDEQRSGQAVGDEG
jgi:signal transduction histidine kinase